MRQLAPTIGFEALLLAELAGTIAASPTSAPTCC